ncbi:ABC transporter ATP-binding protein [Lagierella sp.]|uniref:ABC transporter ATP-binding protein n=1 Tax=Lagierella sp. TaxID=2849657 RepID=UPI00344F5CAE
MKNKNSASKRLFGYAKRESKNLTLGIICTFIRTGLEIVGPLIIGHLLNNFIKKGMTKDDFLSIGLYLVLYLLVYMISGYFARKTVIFFESASNGITLHVQKDIFKHVQSLPISYFDSLPAGSIVSRITNDTNKLKIMFQNALGDMTTSGIMAITMFLMLLIRHTRVAVYLLVLVPIILWIFYDLRTKYRKYTTEIRKLTSKINADINENIQNMEIIQAFNKEDLIKEEFDSTNQAIWDNAFEMTKVRSYGGYRAMDIVSYFASIIVLVYFGIGRITGNYQVDVGSLYIVINYVNKMMGSLTTIVTWFGELEQSYASAKHVFDLFELKPDPVLPEKLGNIEGVVEFKDVYFAYDKDYVLKDINFKVDHKSSVAFVGSTGSGKSTILNLILNFYSPQKGSILIDGQDIKNVDKISLREEMAVVLQDSFLFEATIRDNIKLDDDFTDEEINNALEAVGGHRLVKRGLDTPLKEGGRNLSQGEQQLISFARAYIREPKLLILDEATSNIDTETESIIQKGIEKLKEDRTTLIVAHRLSTIKDVDMIYVLSKGRIIEKGNHKELMDLSGFYRSMYEEQIEEKETA